MERNFRCSDFRMAVCSTAYTSFVACCMVKGDFSTPLRCTRNDRDGERFEERELRFEGGRQSGETSDIQTGGKDLRIEGR